MKVMAMEIIDKSFRKAPKKYIIQSLLATIAVVIILYFVEFLTHAAIVAALGIAAHEWSYQTIIFILVFAICLALVRRLLRGYLRALF